MKEEKEVSHIKYYFFKFVAYIIFAIIVAIFRDYLIEHLKYFIATLMLLYALEELFFELIYSRHKILHQKKIYHGAIEIVLVFTIAFVDVSYTSVCIIWAIWSILREAYEIEEVIVELKAWLPRIVSFVESLTVIVFSIMLIIEPTEHHALIHLYLLLVELFLNPLIPLVDELLGKKKEKPSKS